MKHLITFQLLTVFLLSVSSCAVAGNNLSGSYLNNTTGVEYHLMLESDASGALNGKITSPSGDWYLIEGIIQDGVGVGACYNELESYLFEIHPQSSDLEFVLINPESWSTPGASQTQTLRFTRTDSAVSTTPSAPAFTNQTPQHYVQQVPAAPPQAAQPVYVQPPSAVSATSPYETTEPGFPGMGPPATPSNSSPSSSNPVPRPQAVQSDVKALNGKFCSLTYWAVFDGAGSFQYGFTGADRETAGRGFYRIQENVVYLIYPDGDSETALISGLNFDGGVTSLMYGGELFSRNMCP